jgi:hypothetical protein
MHDAPLVYGQWYPAQMLANAGALNAGPGVDFEPRAVSVAGNVGAIAIEISVALPGEAYAARIMRAEVAPRG